MENGYLKIHQEHTSWVSDLQMWSKDLRICYEEMEALKETLEFINDAVKSHEDGLMDHLKMLIDHSNKLNKHEREILYIVEGTGLDSKLTDLHKGEANHHDIYRDAHERLKKYHHTVMTRARSFKKSLIAV
jgi:hypothetical protein